MATDYGKRLKKAMEHAKINQKELVKRTGLSQSTISSAINRSTGSSHTPLFAKACGVSAIWLSSNVEPMEIQAKPIDPQQTISILNEVEKTRKSSSVPEAKELSQLARYLAETFDRMIGTEPERIAVLAELTTFILQSGRQQQPRQTPEPLHAQSPKRQPAQS